MFLFFRTLYVAALTFSTFALHAQNKAWEQFDIIRFYTQNDLEDNVLSEEGEEAHFIYVPTQLEEGRYEIDLEKVTNKLYLISGTELFVYFRYPVKTLGSQTKGELVVRPKTATFYRDPITKDRGRPCNSFDNPNPKEEVFKRRRKLGGK